MGTGTILWLLGIAALAYFFYRKPNMDKTTKKQWFFILAFFAALPFMMQWKVDKLKAEEEAKPGFLVVTSTSEHSMKVLQYARAGNFRECKETASRLNEGFSKELGKSMERMQKVFDKTGRVIDSGPIKHASCYGSEKEASALVEAWNR